MKTLKVIQDRWLFRKGRQRITPDRTDQSFRRTFAKRGIGDKDRIVHIHLSIKIGLVDLCFALTEMHMFKNNVLKITGSRITGRFQSLENIEQMIIDMFPLILLYSAGKGSTNISQTFLDRIGKEPTFSFF